MCFIQPFYKQFYRSIDLLKYRCQNQLYLYDFFTSVAASTAVVNVQWVASLVLHKYWNRLICHLKYNKYSKIWIVKNYPSNCVHSSLIRRIWMSKLRSAVGYKYIHVYTFFVNTYYICKYTLFSYQLGVSKSKVALGS